jgi:hypothetical protein
LRAQGHERGKGTIRLRSRFGARRRSRDGAGLIALLPAAIATVAAIVPARVVAALIVAARFVALALLRAIATGALLLAVVAAFGTAIAVTIVPVRAIRFGAFGWGSGSRGNR